MGVGKLTKLTVNEILRAANHDFINQLQLIKMNLDLNRIDDAKKIIENYFANNLISQRQKELLLSLTDEMKFDELNSHLE